MKFSHWDSLNKSAIIVTLVTGVTGILTFLGSQLLSAIILLSVACAAILFLIIRNIQHKRKLKNKDSMLNEVFQISGNLAAEILNARHDIFSLFNKPKKDLTESVMQSLQRCMESRVKIANSHTGGNCRASCSILTTNGGDKEVFAQTVARGPSAPNVRQSGDIGLPLKYLTESEVIRTGKPLIFDDLKKLAQERNRLWKKLTSLSHNLHLLKNLT